MIPGVNRIVICPHCEGTGFCKPSSQHPGCSFCIASYRETQKEVPLILIPCAFCKGSGVICRSIEEFIEPEANEDPVPVAEILANLEISSTKPVTPSKADTTLDLLLTPEQEEIFTNWLYFFQTLFTGMFLFLCYWPTLTSMKPFFISLDLLIWFLAVVILLPNQPIITKLSSFLMKIGKNLFRPKPDEPTNQKVFSNQLLVFLFMTLIINAGLFTICLIKKNFYNLTSATLSQVILMPTIFIGIIFCICNLERFQRRVDFILRLSALIYATVLVITCLVYLKMSLTNFWASDQLLLVIVGLFGLAVSSGFLIFSPNTEHDADFTS